MSRFPEYEPIGMWWTVDAPSLRVPDPAHDYVSIWSAGDDGPSILLVPPKGSDHTAWEHLVPELAPHFTVHAMDARVADRDVVGVRTAADAVGARIVVADGDAADAAVQAARANDTVLLCERPRSVAAPEADVAGASDDNVQTIRLRADADGADQLITALRAVSGPAGPPAQVRSVDDQERGVR
ncbi:alpha/beta fold hydrolase [Mycobacterium sp. DBP42]|uniref:alpha/beta fold hydrolase n=1 Tax=Mycobacterium sp. DBP42 TaxID=2545267 RepID=UPI00110CDBD6|nr:hypothetical protein [Mycobacterium sp. DBP42]TMS52455.1 hypothetical protein E0T84_16205 [Mycobacterium sp. DBP42]